MNKYEQLIEHIINDETDKARELFHTIVVEKSRDIYESLIDETDLEEVGGNQVQGLVDEITIDEQGISEEEDEGAEFDADAEEAGEELDAGNHDEAEIEDRVVDLEDALDELKAEFDALMAGESHEEEHDGEEHGEEDHGDELELDEGNCAMEEESEEEEEVEESIVREYVEKAPAPTTSEEGAVNKSSTVAGKNDMGGSAANIATGKANPAPDGTSPKGAVKAKGTLPHAGSYENVPGAKAGNAFAKKETAVKKEEGAVNATSPLAK